jgi:hypothetical protein
MWALLRLNDALKQLCGHLAQMLLDAVLDAFSIGQKGIDAKCLVPSLLSFRIS